jgi:hypothetical protein
MPGMPTLPWGLVPFCPLNAPKAIPRSRSLVSRRVAYRIGLVHTASRTVEQMTTRLASAQQNFPQLQIVPPSLASHTLCPQPRQTDDGDGDVTFPGRVN